jgi:hypothetical protein
MGHQRRGQCKGTDNRAQFTSEHCKPAQSHLSTCCSLPSRKQRRLIATAISAQAGNCLLFCNNRNKAVHCDALRIVVPLMWMTVESMYLSYCIVLAKFLGQEFRVSFLFR